MPLVDRPVDAQNLREAMSRAPVTLLRGALPESFVAASDEASNRVARRRKRLDEQAGAAADTSAGAA